VLPTTARRIRGARYPVGVALGALCLAAAPPAAADGEKTPMIGGAVEAGEMTAAAGPNLGIVGVRAEAAWWWGHFALAAEGALRTGVDGAEGHAAVLGASLRVRVLDGMLHSPIEPSDVELGVELQAVVEHAWWDASVAGRAPTSYGLGLALRLRGGGDEDFSTLIAESRLFVRVLSSRWTGSEVAARATTPMTSASGPSFTFIVGVGASFGTGDRAYVRRFAPHPLEPELSELISRR
jgi:hypothetical protein